MGGYCENVMVGEKARERYLSIFYILLSFLYSLGLLCLFCVVIGSSTRSKLVHDEFGGIIGQVSCLNTG